MRGKGAALLELNSAETTQGSCSSQHGFSLAEQELEQAESTGEPNREEKQKGIQPDNQRNQQRICRDSRMEPGERLK